MQIVPKVTQETVLLEIGADPWFFSKFRLKKICRIGSLSIPGLSISLQQPGVDFINFFSCKFAHTFV